MYIASRITKYLGYAWIGVMALIVALSHFLTLAEHGVGVFADVYSPFNMWYGLTMMLLFSPGIGLIYLAGKLEERYYQSRYDNGSI